MSPSQPSPAESTPAPSDKPHGAGGEGGAPRCDRAGSGNTLGDGRTAGGGYNADKRDELTDDDAGGSHGDER